MWNRIHLVTVLRTWIRIRILLLNKVMQICDHWSTDSGLHFKPLRHNSNNAWYYFSLLLFQMIVYPPNSSPPPLGKLSDFLVCMSIVHTFTGGPFSVERDIKPDNEDPG